MNRAIAAVANAAPYHLTTSLDACPLERFWVVQLDCHLEVYQNDKSPDFAEPDPWMRLKKFCQDHGAIILNMALARRNPRDPRQINLDPMSDGYFYSERHRQLVIHPTKHYQDHAVGVGELKGDKLTILWMFDNDQEEVEVKDLTELHPKHQSMNALIRRHEKLNLPV
jgi:hypothetical protein